MTDDYGKYYCPIHRITILYLKEHSHISGKYHCWDCIRDSNNKQNSKHTEERQK